MKQRLRSLLRRLGVVVISSRHAAVPFLDNWPLSSFSLAVLRRFPSLERLHFIQIGANDGRRYDPIAPFIDRHHWRGVMVEPVPSNFRSLSALRAANPDITLLCAAVDAFSGQRSIFHLRENLDHTVPDWVWGMASFDRAFIQQAVHSLGRPETDIAETTVPTVTWPQVFEKAPDGACDILVVDAEGHDVRLLLLLDWDNCRPTLVHFEHKHASPDERLALYRILLERGYELSADSEDTTACLPPGHENTPPKNAPGAG